MPVPELIRDSFVGQIIYLASGRRLFNYLEDRPGFVLPERYSKATKDAPSGTSSETATLTDRQKGDQVVSEKQPAQVTTDPETPPADAATNPETPADEVAARAGTPIVRVETPAGSPLARVLTKAGSPLARVTTRPGSPLTRVTTKPGTPLARVGTKLGSPISRVSTRRPCLEESTVGQEILRCPTRDIEKGKIYEEQERRAEEEKDNPNLVTWYGEDDPESPQNWSIAKKCFVTFDICLLTFSIYIGSAIYTPGIGDLTAKFGVSEVAATLGLTMFVIGYGVGPMFLSPLSEIPQIGRTSVYIISLGIFVVLQVPTALCKNLGALLPLRFLAGFVGSPALATGGASLIDIWSPGNWAIVIGLWSLSAVCGPVLGPLVGGFSAQAEGWTWTIWVLMWLSGGSFVILAICLPETSAQAVLYRRAVRLRRVTGNQNLRSQGEMDAASMTLMDIAMIALVRPFVLSFTEPIVISWNMYIALAYGILYIFIESFKVVFIEGHGFNIGENGLAFMGIFVGAVIAYALLVPYAVYVLKPMFANGPQNFIPEARLPIAMVGGICMPISLFWFGWTSTHTVHWISPIIASGLFSISVYSLFQAGLNYLPDCYPRHVASVLAGNDFFRSMIGAAFPLFSTAFFHNLGVGQACSVLGGISVAMLPIPFILYKYGALIRSWSKFAD